MSIPCSIFSRGSNIEKPNTNVMIILRKVICSSKQTKINLTVVITSRN